MTTTCELDARIEWVTALLQVRVLMAQGAGPDNAALAGAMERAVDALGRAERDGTATLVLRERFGLTRTECDLVWHLVAHALDARVRELMVNATGELVSSVDALRVCVHGETVTVASLLELGADAALLRWGLVEETSTTQPPRRVWSVPVRVLAWLKGDREVDPRLGHLARIPAAMVTELVVERGTDNLLARAVQSPGALVVVAGIPGAGRRTIARAAAEQAGLQVLELDASRLSRDGGRYTAELQLLARECALLGRTPLVRGVDALSDDRLALLDSCFMSRVQGVVLVTAPAGRRALAREGRPSIVVEVRPLGAAQRARLWLAALGQGTQEDADLLAAQFPLAPALVHHAARAARAHASGRPLAPDDIYAGIRAVLDERLGLHASRVEITQRWDDLVLPADQMEAVQYLIARIRHRTTVYEQWGFAKKLGKGLGTAALFSGPPGTGKSMLAGLIARELGLELYQVDMARLVSKYIGETERNLAALFDAAEAGHAILLFDEADSLFGKRTDVKSSNDRYANLETNYLLQRLESFKGTCLLTSNHEANIDPAFQRRLALHLRIDLPDVREREALWKAVLPSSAPIASDLQLGGLARRFAMSGGYIRNAALRAAFAAASEGTAITASLLERAARAEYEGMGKIVASAP